MAWRKSTKAKDTAAQKAQEAQKANTVSDEKAGEGKPGAEKPDAEKPSSEKQGPSPLTTLILADIALSAGSALLQRGSIGRALAKSLPASLGAKAADGSLKTPSLAGSLVGTALARVATRSVPGAILVGGGLVAKALYNKRKAQKAKGRKDA
ncbi:hypothetical protein [Novosphingobium pituita]|uniref:DUF4126 domain-containing protein n=1 Tax=Novosphingobium pituita TaxID=3056842 RepID=A0ABQ6P907_9SPHN|nr:hypothetical protein [Novosphingobium sp. IK01]MDK4805316.1 hypothetical protein [Novosphingobium aromaticivorans]GMM60611.1 hypothetical protein NUTIK01_13880 [Novosphingobium sp. IK01]